MIMMGGDKKKAINLILGPREEEKKDEGGGDSALSQCMSEFIQAIHAKDVGLAVESFKSCFASLEAEEPGESEEGD